MTKLTRYALLLICLSFLWACEEPEPEQPPEWVREAHQRSEQFRKYGHPSTEAQREADRRHQEEVERRKAEQKAKRDKPQIANSLLWRVDGEAGPVYLFGTIHGGIRSSWDDFPRHVDEALEASSLVVFEVDMENLDRKSIVRAMALPEGESLRAKIGEERFAKLAQKVPYPEAMLDRLQPWAVTGEVARSLFSRGRAVDKIVHIEAQVHDKDLQYLETAKEQIDALQRAFSVEQLVELLDNYEESKVEAAQLLDAYRAGDAERLESIVFAPEDVERFPTHFDAIFAERNEKWVPQLEAYAKKGDVFVAVGAGHLVGDNSVVKMLRQKGYTVERVDSDAETEKTDPADPPADAAVEGQPSSSAQK